MQENRSFVFILRAWPEEGSEGDRWRWSLMENDAAERIGFPSLDELYLYLSALTSGSNGEQNEGGRQDDR